MKLAIPSVSVGVWIVVALTSFCSMAFMYRIGGAEEAPATYLTWKNGFLTSGLAFSVFMLAGLANAVWGR